MFKFKTLGSAPADPSTWATLKYPGYVSPKIDGWRSVEYNSRAVTRSLKPIKNDHTRTHLEAFFKVCAGFGIKGLDGEVTVGPANAPDVMQRTTSGLSTKAGTPEFEFHLFDSYQFSQVGFIDRWLQLKAKLHMYNILTLFPFVKLVEQHVVKNEHELLHWEEHYLSLGYEGVMFRSADGHYKMGHSTFREGIMLKMKRLTSAEAEIISVQELESNQNEPTLNELGHTERKGGQAGMVPAGTFGSAKVRDEVNFPGQTFNIGMGKGLTEASRAYLWSIRDTLPGQLVTYEWFNVGIKDKPRFPRWISLRMKEDLG